MGIDERNRVDTDLTNNGYYTWDPNEAYIQGRILETYRDFFYEFGRFPGNNNIVPIPKAIIPRFIESRDVLSPLALYERYAGRDIREIVSVQFLATLNIFLGRDSELLREAMSELFHNLSWQALTNDNDRYQIQFHAITMLVQSMNQRLQRHVMEHRRQTKKVDNQILEQLLTQQIAENKTEISKIEDKIAADIINENKTDYGQSSPPLFPKNEEEIDYERREETKEYLKTELAKRERDFETIQNIDIENQLDLIKSALDPLDGQIANDAITSADYNRTEHNEPLPPRVDPNVLKIIDKIVYNANAFVNKPDPIPPHITLSEESQPPKASPIIKNPNLHDIITEPKEEDIISQLKAVKEEVKQEEVVLLPPEKTGIAPVDEKNYEEYLDTFEVIRPDLFIDEEDNYVEPSAINALVPVGTMDFVPSDLADIIVQPEVETILLPTDTSLPAILPTPAYFVPVKERTFAPMDEDDYIDFIVSKLDEALTVSLPIEIDTNNITLTDDGDVKPIDPENMQVEDRALVPVGDGTVALPMVQDMELIRTKNIILKRKNDTLPELGNIKMIKNETDIRVRDVVPRSENKAILPYSDIKHPIQRKMEKRY